MSKTVIIVGVLLSSLLIVTLIAGLIMSHTEHPQYKIISSEKNIELRVYEPMIVAKVNMEGSRQDSMASGFKILADYIFGNNLTHSSIAMTAPVQQQKSDELWTVSFIMPSKYNMEDLPLPNNTSIIVEDLSQKRFIVLRFSGHINDNNIISHEESLLQYVLEHQLKTIGSPKYAFYNPPWTLSFMRRNEVMIALFD